VEMVNHVTGFDYTVEEVCQLGRRVWYLKRGLSNLFGARAEDDRLPKRLMTPLQEGPTEGSLPDMELMLKEFYQLRGFDEEGIPRRDVLMALDLPELADLLHPLRTPVS
jgi:aldehyde:ferredoxin oxidoreductase